MKIFGLNVTRAKAAAASDASTQPQLLPYNPQGPLTGWFQEYVLRKVSGDFYEALREGIPIIDSAIRRLISLNGTIKVIGDNGPLVRELEDFCTNVPVNDMQKGIHAFLENASNETFEQGFALSEFILTPDLKDIAGLRVADSKQIVFRRNAEGRALPYYRQPGYNAQTVWSRPETIVQRILTSTYSQSAYLSGMWESPLTPDNKLYFSINNENTDPYGVSVMRSMEFVSKILMTMQNSIMNVWERFGDPSYHVKYKTTRRDLGAEDIEARRKKIASDFTNAITSKRAGKSADFITAVNADADITIEVIGHDNNILQLDVPARHILEQIVSKTGLPAWMLGIYWSTTERMATLEVESALQDAKVRDLAMLPEFIRLFSTFLLVRGRKWKTITTDPRKPGDWGICFETPNLHDLVAQAQARFLNAQADFMQGGGYGTGTQTSVTVGGASPSITVVTKDAHGGHNHKELFRPTPWPELDAVETAYENNLKASWADLEERVFTIARLHQERSSERSHTSSRNGTAISHQTLNTKEDVPPETVETFTFSEEQRRAIMEALRKHLTAYDPADPDSPVRAYYGQSYSLGLIQGAYMMGAERPILDILKNKEIYDELCRSGFQLVKDNATRAIVDSILPEIEAHAIAGSPPKGVAARLERLFTGQNSDWDRLARSEMSMAAERAKLDEWTERDLKMVEFTPAPDACPTCMALAGDYPIGKCPIPVQDTHPRCRCSIRPAASEV